MKRRKILEVSLFYWQKGNGSLFSFQKCWSFVPIQSKPIFQSSRNTCNPSILHPYGKVTGCAYLAWFDKPVEQEKKKWCVLKEKQFYVPCAKFLLQNCESYFEKRVKIFAKKKKVSSLKSFIAKRQRQKAIMGSLILKCIRISAVCLIKNYGQKHQLRRG